MPDEPSAELLSEYGCPVACFQQAISGKYKLRILWDLRNGPLRYGEIKKSLSAGIPGNKEIAPRVLSRELKTLTNLGWIERKDYAVMPLKVEYRLTTIGQSLIPSISGLHQWGLTYLIGADTLSTKPE